MIEFSKHIFGIYLLIFTMIVGAFTSYTMIVRQQKFLLSKDIQLAIEKGIDPMAIRCAYAVEDDKVCLVRTAIRGTNQDAVTYKTK